MKKATLVLFSGAVLLVAGVVWAAPSEGSTHRLYTLQGFVEMLIEKQIIPSDYAAKARELTTLISRVEDERNKGPMNADKVEVRVSQLIQYANLTFTQIVDVRGLLLTVHNRTDEAVTLEGKRGCLVVYRIYDGDDRLLFDSRTSEKCRESTEQVTYVLQGGGTRMFEVSHTPNAYRLEPGTYRFELDYPGYGKGDRTVVIE